MSKPQCSVGNHIGVCYQCKSRNKVKPIFTTKHYKAIAKILDEVGKANSMTYEELVIQKKEHPLRHSVNAVQVFIELLKADNPKFDEKKFRKSVNKS